MFSFPKAALKSFDIHDAWNEIFNADSQIKNGVGFKSETENPAYPLPIGAAHDTDEGPIGRNAEAGLCLICGAPIDITGIDDPIGRKLAGGEPNPDALAKPSSSRPRRTGRATTGSGSRTTAARKTSAAKSGRASKAG